MTVTSAILLLQFAPFLSNATNLNKVLYRFFGKSQLKMSSTIFTEVKIISSWDAIISEAIRTPVGTHLSNQATLRSQGNGNPHVDVKLRLFGTREEPRLTFFRDTAGWCPYCQKLWIFLEEKRIPHRVEKINMRSYGDKPPAFLRMVPNGLLPAIVFDGKVQTESLDIMLALDKVFSGSSYPEFWPRNNPDLERAKSLMKLEREIFSLWCSLVFRPPIGNSAYASFERGLDMMNRELLVTGSPWFLENLSIVDLTYISHMERMIASVAYWCGFRIRNNGRWPAIDRWLLAFEDRPTYLATKSDYYTHVMDIPPQYGPGYFRGSDDAYARQISGADGSWTLPLPSFTDNDLEPVFALVGKDDLGEIPS